MKRIILVSMLFLAFTSFMPLNAQWAKVYGMNLVDYDYACLVNSIYQTNDGGYIIAGGVNHEMRILKLDSTGGIEWQRAYLPGITARSIQQTSDGGYIVADCNFRVLKLDSSGNIEWQRDYRIGTGELAFSFQQTSDGGFIVGGATKSIGSGEHDILVLKLDSTGGIEWYRAYGGSSNELAYSLQQTSDGGFIVGGAIPSFGSGDSDILVLKLDSVGNIDWQKTYGGSGSDSANSIQQTNDGGFIVGGATSSFGNGYYDIWALKLNPAGGIEWQRTYGRCANDDGLVAQQKSDGGYIVVGKTTYLIPQQLYEIGGLYYWTQDSRDAILLLKISPNGDIDPSCELIGSSNASVLDTNVNPYEINIIAQDIDLTPLDTNIVPHDTDADVNRLWPDPTIFDLSISSASGGYTEPAEYSYYTFVSGTDISIEAIPEDRYRFKGWTGDVPTGHENDNPITITMDSDKIITATFSTIKEDSDGKKGACFIATAAYGSPLHPHVKILQDFRNKYLMRIRVGRALVNLYYKYSPFFADLVAKHKVLRIGVRIGLVPIVAFSYFILHFGPATTAFMALSIFVFPVFLNWLHRKKLRGLKS